MCNPYLRNGDLCFKGGACVKTIWNSAGETFFYVTYLLIQLFILVWTHRHIIYIWLIMQFYLIYFVTQIFFSFGHWGIFPLVLCIPLVYYHHCSFFLFCFVLFFWALPYFLALSEVPGSPCKFSGTVLKWTVSLRRPGSLFLENWIRNQDLHAYYCWGGVASSPQAERARECVYVCAQSLQSCPTLWDPVDCSPPSSSVHGILREKLL